MPTTSYTITALSVPEPDNWAENKYYVRLMKRPADSSYFEKKKLPNHYVIRNSDGNKNDNRINWSTILHKIGWQTIQRQCLARAFLRIRAIKSKVVLSDSLLSSRWEKWNWSHFEVNRRLLLRRFHDYLWSFHDASPKSKRYPWAFWPVLWKF